MSCKFIHLIGLFPFLLAHLMSTGFVDAMNDEIIHVSHPCDSITRMQCPKIQGSTLNCTVPAKWILPLHCKQPLL